MQNIIFLIKVGYEKKKQLKIDIHSMPITEVTHTCSATIVFLKYDWTVNYKDNNAAVKLELQEVKKYWSYITQVADKLNNL